MLKTNLSLIVVAVVCIFSAQQSPAGPLTSAEVTKIINRVSVIDPAKGGHPATIRDIIKDDLGLQTGAKSRSELLFQDNTLTRLGAETFFSFKTGTRDMTLEKGSMLLQVPKGLGGAKIHTAAVTAAITGTTIMMEYIPKQYIKVLVLEGSLRLSRNGAPGDSVLLRPGKMVIMRPDANKIPDPVDVNLEHIVKTSPLVNFPGGDTLPSMPLIQAAISDQAKELAKGILLPTNLVIGHGTRVILASNDQLAKTLGRVGLGGSLPANASTNALIAVNNTLGSRGVVTNGLLGGNLTGTTVSVSNSNQLLTLLNNATPGSGGTITITPATVNAGANVTVAGAGTVNTSVS
ncbi:MAG TPA: FecR family protein, partial [Chthoniobacterales bacterium]|nr:FecR family protein [Chthoniobacterales bacterium]